MPELTSPYGFAPLNETVVFPEWAWVETGDGQRAPAPMHDIPFRDGLEAEIPVRIEAETPIFSRGVGDATGFFQLPDGRYALAGSSLRGAFRNLVEIASFGKLGYVNDHRYAVRDLHNRDLYLDHMAALRENPRTRRKEPMPLVEAGWLEKAADWDSEDPAEDQIVARITPCDFAKVEYDIITAVARERARREQGAESLKTFDPGRKQSAPDKYRAWYAGVDPTDYGAQERVRRVRVGVAPLRPRGGEFLTEFGKVTGGGGRDGILVFTGQPQAHRPDRVKRRGAGNPKHHDFVFLQSKGAAPAGIDVSRATFRDFEFAHSAGGEQHALRGLTPNEEWAFWKARFEAGARVPVFFLRERRHLRAFGLAMMFRLTYRHSIGESVRRWQPQCREDKPDLAEAIFGFVRSRNDGEAGFASRGRVSFSHAVEQIGARPGREVKAVLSQPKASFYPGYVEQDPKRPGSPPRTTARSLRDGRRKETVTWRTYMDDDVRVRGWKRYRPREREEVPPLPTRADGRPISDDATTRFRPLPAGSRFESTLSVRNLKPVELGAIVWALTLGGDAKARHTLGMARPLGFGRCRVHVDLDHEVLEYGGGRTWTLRACRDAFEAYMETKSPGWRQSDTIRELLALAHVAPVEETRYPRVSMDGRTNEFADAKKRGLVVPRVSPPGEAEPTRHRPASVPHRSPSAPPATPQRRGWPGMRRGDRLRVRLTQQNKKGKWRCEAVEYIARGVIVDGTPPADAAVGQEYEVEVRLGADKNNLNLVWKD